VTSSGIDRPATLRLPEPCLIVLVGAAGSGKSTLAARLFPPDSIFSSDANRALVAGDPTDQGATRTAFSILHRQVERRLAAGRSCVVDATNVEVHARRALTRRAASHGILAVAIVLDLPPRLVLARNAAREGRIVPEAVVRRQLESLARSRRAGLEADGFAAIHVVRSAAQLDALIVEYG